MEKGPYCWICGNYVEEAEDQFKQPQLLDIQYDPLSKTLVQTVQVTMVFCAICSGLEHIQRHLKRAKPKPATKPKRKKKPPVADQGDQIKE